MHNPKDETTYYLDQRIYKNMIASETIYFNNMSNQINYLSAKLNESVQLSRKTNILWNTQK